MNIKRVSRLLRLVSTIKIGVHLFYDNKPDGDQALTAKHMFDSKLMQMVKSNQM